jgi:hypothetical protein
VGDFFGPIVVQSGAGLNPGKPAGTLYGTSVTFASGSTFTCDVGVEDDTLQAEALDIRGASLVLAGTPTLPVQVLARYTTLTGQFAAVPALPAGYTLDYDYTGNGYHEIALTRAANAFETWAQASITAIDPGADATPGGDPDGDGMSNITEFALDGNPLSGAADGKVLGKIASVAGSPALVLTLPVRTGAAFSGTTEQVSGLVDGLVYKIQGTADLTAWNLAVSEVTGSAKTTIESDPKLQPLSDGSWTYRTFRCPGTVTGNPADYLRAVIVQP